MRGISLALLVLCPVLLAAQNEQELAQGKALFRSNCAFCHGLTGGGGRGPTLSAGHFQHGSTDEDLKSVIRGGLPGTDMPAFRMDQDDLNHLVAYIRFLGGAFTHNQSVPGNPARGRQIYARRGCGGCHEVGNEGSVFGPDLSRVGAARSADYIRQSLVRPSADIPPEYEGVTVVTREGRRVTGVRVNEDTFTVQLRDAAQNFRMFRKDEVKEVIDVKHSLMPAYGSLPAGELRDLVAYLVSLRGATHGTSVKQTEGIR